MKYLKGENRPIQYIRNLQDELNKIMEDTFGEFNLAETGEIEGGKTWRPALEMQEKEGNYILKAELPGVNKDNVDVKIDENSITLEAVTENKHEEENQEGFYRSELRYGKFYRKLNFPSEVDSEHAEAEFKDGILIISVPKLHLEEKKMKKLEIKNNPM